MVQNYFPQNQFNGMTSILGSTWFLFLLKHHLEEIREGIIKKIKQYSHLQDTLPGACPDLDLHGSHDTEGVVYIMSIFQVLSSNGLGVMMF